MNQFLISKLLRKWGYKHSHVVENGLKALQIMKVSPFDVILMDVIMPEMDGIEATKRIRKEIESTKQPFIIALTANAFEEVRKTCLSAGMDDVVTKPIQYSYLKNILFNKRKAMCNCS